MQTYQRRMPISFEWSEKTITNDELDNSGKKTAAVAYFKIMSCHSRQTAISDSTSGDILSSICQIQVRCLPALLTSSAWSFVLCILAQYWHLRDQCFQDGCCGAVDQYRDMTHSTRVGEVLWPQLVHNVTENETCTIGRLRGIRGKKLVNWGIQVNCKLQSVTLLTSVHVLMLSMGYLQSFSIDFTKKNYNISLCAMTQ